MGLIRPEHLKKGDEVSVVSLSSGILGEKSSSHQKRLLESRLREMGLGIHYTKNSLKGLDYIRQHPEKRAEDLIEAFSRKETKIIWSAIGGNDTYRIIPFLENSSFKTLVKNNPKIFMGFSDTTIDHLFLYKLGLVTYYGPALLPDVADPGNEIVPYTKQWLSELFCSTRSKTIDSSKNWYRNRGDFGEDQLGIPLVEEAETHNYEFFNGDGIIQGRLLGGCLESLAESLNRKDSFFPNLDEWKEKVLFIETSEERPSVGTFERMVSDLDNFGIFGVVNAVIVGKPQDEVGYSKYKKVLLRVTSKYSLPLVYNMNFGHASPRIILPYGQNIVLDFKKRKSNFDGEMFARRHNSGIAK